MLFCQEDPSKIQQGRKSGKWLKVEIIAVNGPMSVVSAVCRRGFTRQAKGQWETEENGCAAILALAMEAREPCCDLARSGSHPHVDNTSSELASHPSVPLLGWCRCHLHDGISRPASTNTYSESFTD